MWLSQNYKDGKLLNLGGQALSGSQGEEQEPAFPAISS